MTTCFKTTKEHKHWSRHNGWSLPLHPLQVLAWFFLVMFALLYFGILVPNMPPGAWQITACVINAATFIFHIVIHLTSVSLNPADINVRAKANTGPLPSFDRSKHNHVIENEYCHICEVKVGRKSKHCSACNKCVSEFDHHCKWLNNCVGGRNYKLFISCVSSALCGCLIIFVSSIVLIIAFFSGSSWLNSPALYGSSKFRTPPVSHLTNTTNEFLLHSSTIEPLLASPHPLNTTFSESRYLAFVPIRGSIWVTIVFCTAALSLLAIALLGHLLGFHIFLMCQNFSTYDYIVQKRDPGAVPTKERKDRFRPFGCPFLFLQQIKAKKANQISPKSQDNGTKSDDVEEWEMQANVHQRSPNGNKASLPVVTENMCAASMEDEDPLENYVGDVYIGSPHRRRHYLEPLNLRSKYSNSDSKDEKEQETPKKCERSPERNKDRDIESLNEEDDQELSSSMSQSHVYSHGPARRHHRSPSPAPLLSPILESEISTGSAMVSWKHRSVSEQSLHTLDESEEESMPASSSCTVQMEQTGGGGMGSREDSGSLSNLFLSKEEQFEEVEEDNNNTINDDNQVHEVCIIPQKPFDERESNHDASSQETPRISNVDDSVSVNKEVWAYAPRNGCQVRDGVVSFRRSYSMQESEKMPHDPLTRCCSEDELKSAQRMTKLQRRLSEDHDLWMLTGSNNFPKTWKEHSPKTGRSATAVFCVDEPDESFRIPGIPFGIKRKYNHFSVPNHIVLPCSNSVHPESRKRTRAVGSKPPKAFHA